MTDNEIALAATSEICGVPKKKILSSSRAWPEVEARMLIALLLSEEGKHDISIAWALNRGRSSVYRARIKAASTLEISKTFRIKYEKISQSYGKRKSLRAS